MMVQTMKKDSRKRLVAYAAAGASMLAAAGSADAGFVGPYDVMNWTFTNTPGGVGGSINTSGAPSTIVITGGNSGTGGTTDFTISAAGDGLVSFNFGYTSGDSGNFDQAGFLLNGAFTQLADNSNQVTPFNGSFSKTVKQGDSIGFRVVTLDGAFGAGFFSITNFEGPNTTSSSVVPEPSSMALLALGAVGALLYRRRRNGQLQESQN